MSRVDQTHGPSADTGAERTPRGSRLLLSTQSVLEIVLLAGILLLTFLAATDPDLWWHLATGRYIVETGTIPQSDPFSYTAFGNPWFAHEWLSEIWIYSLYRLWGYSAAVAAFAAIVALTYWLLLRTLRLLRVGAVGATLLVTWAAAMSYGVWTVRPQMFSLLFFSLFLYILCSASSRRSRLLWLMPPVMVLWVNLHAGYIMGLMLVGMWGVGLTLDWLLERRRGNSDGDGGVWSSFRKDVGTLWLAAAATLTAAILNPRGLLALVYPFSYAGTQNGSMRWILEWQSPNFHQYYFYIFGGSILALMILPSSRGRWWRVNIPLLVLAAMSLQSVRTIPFYAIVMAVAVATRLEDAAGPLGLEGHAGTTRAPFRTTWWNWGVLAASLAVLGAVLLTSNQAQLGRDPLTRGYPEAGVRYLMESGLDGRLFNAYRWGGFLVWRFYPERRVFIDGRADMYGDAMFDDYQKMDIAAPDWKDMLYRYQIDVALVEKDKPSAVLLRASSDWREVFQGDIESVFVRDR